MKIGVAMSGGIDSSVVAFLLKQQGYDIFGFTCDLDGAYQKPIKKAKQICKKLNIEHFVIDLHNTFYNEIVCNFNKQITEGTTPVPCVMCNKIIKFGLLFDFCSKKGAKMATGHYIKIHNYNNNTACIFKAKDRLKDQTHFVYDINKNIINNIICPLGDYYKTEIFRIAEENNFFIKKQYTESQDVCFFNGKSYKEYIQSLCIKQEKGDIIHAKTLKKLGIHNGLLQYTIGQRQGIGVPWQKPLYVVKRDFHNNILIVGEEEYLYSSTLELKNINLLVDIDDIANNTTGDLIELNCNVCLRDKTPEISANVLINTRNNTGKVSLKTPARAITKGQVCVFYKGDMLCGGGVIC